MHTLSAGLAQDATRRLDKAICKSCIMFRDLRGELTGVPSRFLDLSLSTRP